MAGQSPLNMMHRQRAAPRPADRGRRRWPVLALLVALVALAAGWSWLWYYSASVADRTLAGWIQREATAGRIYSCGSQTITGFPLRIKARCADASGEIKNSEPPLAVRAKDITFVAPFYHPTELTGEMTGPLMVAAPGQPTSFVANWSLARLSVRGIPPEPDSVSVTLDHPRMDRTTGGNDEVAFVADRAVLDGRVVGGTARSNPVIDVTLRFTGVTAPTLHPSLAQPLQGEVEVVVRGFKDLLPKPWAERFREMQAAGGKIELKSLRLARSDAVIIGTGSLTVNEHGRLDGLIPIAVAGLDRVVPLIGIDQLIAQGLGRLGGSSGLSVQGANSLERLLPGLGGAIRDTANAMAIENLKKMGQPTTIENKPAILLPLRITDGSVYLGLVPLGQVQPLF